MAPATPPATAPHPGVLGGSLSGASAALLRDEALAAAKSLEEEASSLRDSNAERSQQLQEEADLLKLAAAA